MAGGRDHQAHDQLGQGGLSAAIGAGEHHQLMVIDGEGDIFQDVQLFIALVDGVADMLQFQLSKSRTSL